MKNQKRIIVTTSWDDGHVLDERLAALLKKYRLPATFYIAPHNREFAKDDLLSDVRVKELAKDFEVGSHTMTHPVLTTVSSDIVRSELTESRRYLQSLTDQTVDTFCYPRGAYSHDMVQMAKDAGYRYARTVEDYQTTVPEKLLEAGTTIEVHRFALPKLLQELRNVFEFSNRNLRQTVRNLKWRNRAFAMFDRVCEEGGVFHLWGHSWVVEREKKWDDLEALFQYIHGRDDVIYCTNSGLVGMGN